MANPQCEDGYLRIAIEIAEALARTNLTAYENRILWALWRKTYGWAKKQDRISLSQFSKLTGLPRSHCSSTLKKLVQRNIVTRSGNTYAPTYAFQKDYDKWQQADVTLRGCVTGATPKCNRDVTERRNGALRQSVETKDTVQKTGKILSQKKLFQSFSRDIQECTNLLLASIQACTTEKLPSLSSSKQSEWKRNTADAIDKLHRVDRVAYDDIRAAIQFCRQDPPTDKWPGWGAVILSGNKLRQHYGEIAAQIEAKERGKRNGQRKVYKRGTKDLRNVYREAGDRFRDVRDDEKV